MLKIVATLIDDARVVIYDCNMFIIQATGVPLHLWVNCHLVGWHGAKKTISNFKVHYDSNSNKNCLANCLQRNLSVANEN